MSDTSTQNTQYMLLFTIGPVQSFIAQARKTRDLWLGSYLLSVLMEAGMEHIQRESLVFPADPTIKGSIPDLPNKYIAIFDSGEQATKAAEESEKRITNCWNSICNDIWKRVVQGAPSDDETKKIWQRQLGQLEIAGQEQPNRFFEVFWVVVAGDRNDYANWLSKTQIALAARKRLRHVREDNPTDNSKYVEEPEQGEKSTISGDREALRNSNTNMYRPAVRAFWQQLIKSKNLSAFDINPLGEERLDAIDTVKRFAYQSFIIKKKLKTENEERKGAGFPSTSSIATASFVEQLLRKADEDSKTTFLKEWLKATKNDSLAVTPVETLPYLYKIAQGKGLSGILTRDGDCYFPETFVQLRLEKDYGVPREKPSEKNHSSTVASDGRQGLRELFKGTDALDITRPTPYYAMIQMDGDKMGVLLGKVSGKTEHQQISEQLSKFSQASETLVEDKYPGRLIYAGGDDVFALAPLARDSAPEGEPLTVLQLADRLQQTYQSIVKDAVVDDERKKNVTASTGIAIAHHFTSLSYVRRASKEAESQAKKTYGRNSLVVTLLRRSGEQTRVGCRWHYDGLTDEGQPIKLFSEFYRLFKEDRLSSKAVYLLLEEAPALVHPALFRSLHKDDKLTEDEWQHAKDSMPKMQESEVKRVLLRQRSSELALSKDGAERLAHNLVELAKAMDADTRGKEINQKQQEDEQDKANKKPETRALELHSEDRRYGLVEVLGWLQVMVFLTRKEQE